MVRQVFNFKFQVDLPIGWLSVEIEKIAERCSLRLERYQEPGLGDARGAVVETESGRAFALQALDALQNHGPQLEVIADGKDIIALGIEVLLDELVSSLSLCPHHILGRNHGVVETAMQRADWLAAGGPR